MKKMQLDVLVTLAGLTCSWVTANPIECANVKDYGAKATLNWLKCQVIAY